MYSGLPFDGIVYEGYLPGTPNVTGGGPQSNVLDNLDDSPGRLGCGVPTVFITNRCANGVNCVIDTDIITDLYWTRVLDDVSEASVTVALSGDVNFTCCQCLAEAQPWCNELHIWRNGQEVWVGPIQKITYGFEEVVIEAVDSLGWLGVRIPPTSFDYTTGSTNGVQDLVTIAHDVLEVAFAEDETSCEIDNLYEVPSGVIYSNPGLFYAGFDQTCLDILRDLGDIGLDFTTVGRTIALVGDSDPLVPLSLLNDEHIMGEIQVTKDGTLMANRYYVHFEGDNGIPASGEAADFYCYGPIEKIRSGDGLQSGIDAGQLADRYVAAGGVAPLVVEIPDGSQLSPDTPWTINELVCGARVDVAITRLCISLTQSFRLIGVEVRYNDSDGEQVGITLRPMNSVAVDL